MKHKINFWKRFWGKNYRLIKNGEVVNEILVYGHKVYFIEKGING